MSRTETPEQSVKYVKGSQYSHQSEVNCRRSVVYIITFERISHVAVVFPLLTLNRCQMYRLGSGKNI